MTLDDIVAGAQPFVTSKEIKGRTYFIRPLTGVGREAYLRFVRDKDQFSIGGVVLFGLCDASGNALGDPFNAEDRAKIGSCDGQLLQALADVMMDISGLTDRSAKEAEKKSDRSPSESSGTD